MLLETERLFIRYFSEEDKGDLYDYLSREEVVKYEPYTLLIPDRQRPEEAARRRRIRIFMRLALKSGKVIGNLYLSKGDYDTWELGYVFNSDFWGNGYAYESAAALITQAFEEWGARRLVAMCNPQNQSSWKLLERLGFRREGTLIRNIYFFCDEAGEPLWQDTYEYGMLKEEWRADADKECV